MNPATIAAVGFLTSVVIFSQRIPGWLSTTLHMVTAVNPLRIVHASTGTMCVTADTKIGKWKYWSWLKDVAEDGGSAAADDTEGVDEPVNTNTTAIVNAPSGSTVNLRAKAKAGAQLIERVPVGSKVVVIKDEGTWAKVQYGSRTGYMMTVFLSPEYVEPELPEGGGTVEERLTRLEARVTALEDEITVG